MNHLPGWGLGLVFLSTSCPLPAAIPHSPEPRTEAAVEAADAAWSAAETHGDAEFVDWLLLPQYQSVSANGKVTSKATIVASARAQAGKSDADAKVAAWRAAHPVRSQVAMFGDTAVLTWISKKPSAGEPTSSCDIFVYRDGHWHGIYSQHAALE